jgi:hypothetical protein
MLREAIEQCELAEANKQAAIAQLGKTLFSEALSADCSIRFDIISNRPTFIITNSEEELHLTYTEIIALKGALAQL